MRPVQAVEADARVTCELILEGLVEGDLAVLVDVLEADAVVTGEVVAGDEVVRGGQPGGLAGLLVVAVVAELPVVQRSPVRASGGDTLVDGQGALELWAVRFVAAV